MADIVQYKLATVSDMKSKDPSFYPGSLSSNDYITKQDVINNESNGFYFITGAKDKYQDNQLVKASDVIYNDPYTKSEYWTGYDLTIYAANNYHNETTFDVKVMLDKMGSSYSWDTQHPEIGTSPNLLSPSNDTGIGIDGISICRSVTIRVNYPKVYANGSSLTTPDNFIFGLYDLRFKFKTVITKDSIPHTKSYYSPQLDASECDTEYLYNTPDKHYELGDEVCLYAVKQPNTNHGYEDSKFSLVDGTRGFKILDNGVVKIKNERTYERLNVLIGYIDLPYYDSRDINFRNIYYNTVPVYLDGTQI